MCFWHNSCGTYNQLRILKTGKPRKLNNFLSSFVRKYSLQSYRRKFQVLTKFSYTNIKGELSTILYFCHNHVQMVPGLWRQMTFDLYEKQWGSSPHKDGSTYPNNMDILRFMLTSKGQMSVSVAWPIGENTVNYTCYLKKKKIRQSSL